MKKSAITCISVFCACAVAQAKTCHWSGMGPDNLWTNPDNWTEGEVPGRYDGSVLASGEDTDEAIFGPVSDGAHTTIDLTGQYCVSNLIFVSGAPAYTFGTSASQEFGLTMQGNLVMQAGVATTQTFACLTMLGYYDSSLGNNRAGSNHSIIRNNGTGLIDFQGGWKHNYNHYLDLHGTGDLRLAGKYGQGYRIHDYADGVFRCESTYTINDGSNLMKLFQPKTLSGTANLRRIDLPNQNSSLVLSDWGGPTWTCTFAANTIVSGQGTFGIYNSRPYENDNPGTGVAFSVSSSYTARFDANVACRARVGLRFVTVTGGGTAQFNGSLTGTHTDLNIKNSSTTLSVAKIGTVGCAASESSIGSGVSLISFYDDNFLEYVGAGESTDRALMLRAAKVGTVRNAGTGALTLTGDMSATVDGAELCFDAKTAPIIVNGIVSQTHPLTGSIAGDDTVTFARECEFQSVEMKGGNLAIGSAVSSLPAVTVTSGNSTIAVPAGKSLTVASVSVTGGTLDFRTDAGASVYVTEVAELSGSVLLNGWPAMREANGLLTQKLTKWANAVDGNWSDAAKWDCGIPQEDWGMEISAPGASYVVTADSTFSAVPLISVISNGTANATATLQFDAPVGFTNRTLVIDAGGVLSASAGLVITNTATGAGTFSVRTGGKLRVTGGSFELPASVNDIGYAGGTIEVTGDAEAMYPASPSFRTGETIFDEHGVLNKRATGGSCYVRPYGPGETATLTFKAARMNQPVGNTSLHIGGIPCSTSIVNFLESDPTKASTNYHKSAAGNPPNFIALGHTAGVGMLKLTGGRIGSGNCGIHIGSTYRYWNDISSDTLNAPTGILEMTGGTLSPSGWGGSYSKFPCGLVVGDASAVKVAGMKRSVGFMYVKGGNVEPNQNITIIGSGHSEGTVVQTGGSISHSSRYTGNVERAIDGTWIYTYPFVVGLAGGIGTYVISNGTLTVSANDFVFVGGATDADLQWGAGNLWTAIGFPIGSHDAKGLFAVRGGTVTVGNSMYLGCDGSGELEIGPSGSLSIGGNLVLSNNVSSTLRVVLGPRSVPDATISGKLVVTDGAHLVVDLTEYGSAKCWTRILNPAGGIEGGFAPENITFVVPESYGKKVAALSVHTSHDGKSGLWLYQPSGMVISFR